MSHALAIVSVPQGKTLHEVMMPYKEYGWGSKDAGIEPYLEFRVEYKPEEFPAAAAKIVAAVIENDNRPEAKNEFQKLLDEGHYTEIFQKAEGGTLNPKTGEWGYFFNPDAKWDWYTIGGRYHSRLLLRNGIRVDSAAIGLVDWDSIQAMQEQQAGEEWDTCERILAGADITMEQFFFEMDGEKKQAVANQIAKAHPGDKTFHVIDILFFNPKGHHTREAYIAYERQSAPAWAFIDLDGKWHEHSKMGWWGMNDGESQEFNRKFWEFVRTAPETTEIACVDYHI